MLQQNPDTRPNIDDVLARLQTTFRVVSGSDSRV